MALEQAKDLQKEQEDHLDEINIIASKLSNSAKTINEQGKTKHRILEGMDEDVEVAREKMNFVMKKLSVLLKTSDTGLLCTVMVLIGILFVLIILVVGT